MNGVWVLDELETENVFFGFLLLCLSRVGLYSDIPWTNVYMKSWDLAFHLGLRMDQCYYTINCRVLECGFTDFFPALRREWYSLCYALEHLILINLIYASYLRSVLSTIHIACAIIFHTSQ